MSLPATIASTAIQQAGLYASIGQGRKAYHRSKNLMKLQRDLDKEMWDYQNKYNLPSAQMQRLKEAGLNPALMYFLKCRFLKVYFLFYVLYLIDC